LTGDWFLTVLFFKKECFCFLLVVPPAAPTSIRDFYRYVRTNFHSHYSNEYYCPISLLRVYGLTHLKQWRWNTWEEESRARQDLNAQAATAHLDIPHKFHIICILVTCSRVEPGAVGTLSMGLLGGLACEVRTIERSLWASGAQSTWLSFSLLATLRPLATAVTRSFLLLPSHRSH
jgi:hypothetical protein